MPKGRISFCSFTTKQGLDFRLNVQKPVADGIATATQDQEGEFSALQRFAMGMVPAVYPTLTTKAENAKGISLAAAQVLRVIRDSKPLEPHLVRNLVSEMRQVQVLTIREMSVGDKLRYDDPAIRWSHYSVIGFSTLTDLTTTVLPEVIRAKDSFGDLTFYFLDALADFGTPCPAMEVLIGREFLNREMPEMEVFVETILRSHYLYHVYESEVIEVSKLLSKSDVGTFQERIAIETLLRLDKTDLIPQQRLDGWWSGEVEKSGEARRLEHIAMLSRLPKGRSWILSKFLAEKPSVRTLIARVLMERVDAADRLGQYRFISRDECERLTKLVASGSKTHDSAGDPDSGVARPFPKEE